MHVCQDIVMILYYLGKLLWFSSFYFFNYYFITPSLRFLSSGADAALLKSEQTNVVVAFFLNWPQDYPALQILFMSPCPQSAHQAALWSSWAIPLAVGLRSPHKLCHEGADSGWVGSPRQDVRVLRGRCLHPSASIHPALVQRVYGLEGSLGPLDLGRVLVDASASTFCSLDVRGPCPTCQLDWSADSDVLSNGTGKCINTRVSLECEGQVLCAFVLSLGKRWGGM